ncbi:hypothetical protein PQX77_004937 [Marasmius sp. AFHP31]|nr:hypothetical protein PQX77_004937 [Marasmius sp. AFHP31]
MDYNALSDLATAGNNIYGSSWIGPPGTQLDAGAQSTALTVLIGGIPLRNDTDSATNSTTGPGSEQPSGTPQDTDSGSTTDPNIAAIVGGSVGGTLLFTCLCIGIWLLLRRYRRQQRNREATEDDYGYQKYSGWSGRDDASTLIGPVYPADNRISVQSWARGVRPPERRRDLDRTRSYTTHTGTVTSASESTMARELAGEIRDLRLQGLRLNERALEESAGPPPEYPASPERTEHYREEKGRLRLA